MRTWILCLLLVLVPLSVLADAKDVKGSKDHPLVGRYDGSVLRLYYAKDFEEVPLLKTRVTGEDKRVKTARNSEQVAGKYWRIVYDGPAGRSTNEVARNFEESLEGKGFEIVFSCRAAECSDAGGSWLFQAATTGPSPAIFGNYPALRYLLAKLDRPQGAVWVALVATEVPGGGAKPVMPQVMVDIVETKGADMDKVVFVGASEMQKSIEATGRVALYGITFDFDSDTIKPESEKTLEEISKLLKNEKTLKLIVTGHTDGKGSFDYNVDLSKRRAISVVKALTSRYGIEAARLRPFGAGAAAPIASNSSEEGRAKNRRVELVKEGIE